MPEWPQTGGLWGEGNPIHPGLASRRLLTSHLSKSQRAEFELTRRIRVRGSDGLTYIIRPGKTFNVLCVERGERFCAHPRGRLPAYDHMLAQMLILETDAGYFLFTAFPRQHLLSY